MNKNEDDRDIFASLLKEYLLKFGDCFPVFEVGGSEEDRIEALRECIKSGKPYETEYKPYIKY